jgi:hypothetical protein
LRNSRQTPFTPCADIGTWSFLSFVKKLHGLRNSRQTPFTPCADIGTWSFLSFVKKLHGLHISRQIVHAVCRFWGVELSFFLEKA